MDSYLGVPVLHTPAWKDKSFWLALGIPAACLVSLWYGLALDAGIIAALCALPATYITLSKGKQAYVLKPPAQK